MKAETFTHLSAMCDDLKLQTGADVWWEYDSREPKIVRVWVREVRGERKVQGCRALIIGQLQSVRHMPDALAYQAASLAAELAKAWERVRENETVSL